MRLQWNPFAGFIDQTFRYSKIPFIRQRPELSLANITIHEFGHYIHNILQHGYKKEGVSGQFNKDAEAMFKWLGVKPYSGPDLSYRVRNLKEKHAEAFAEGFQRYFFEGKAPKGMEGLFRKMSQWVIDLYKEIQNIFIWNGRRSLNLDLSPEMRDVFDRLLTLDEQIQSEVDGMNLTPEVDQFKEALAAAKFPDEMIAKIIEQRDIILTEFKGKILEKEIKKEKRRRTKKRQKFEKGKADYFRKNIATKFPAYRASEALESGKDLDGGPLPDGLNFQIGVEELARLIIETDWENAPEGMTVKGVNLDTVAEFYGYGNAREMIQDIASHPTLDEAAREYAKDEADKNTDWNPDDIEKMVEDEVAEKLLVKNDSVGERSSLQWKYSRPKSRAFGFGPRDHSGNSKNDCRPERILHGRREAL